ncbi:hypothetical protein [Pseudomonas oligotrophica]|uniref:hypothetical protein n=1 Tax=Pseudomonas oligotrophica TaxID=2912055 RepID=UPI001F40FE06|nr:hypothetical protein [Pseudomonas oligotrophica]MCF7202225.1 hypothetical protein [Pseudomonas oligotrophica]
MSRVPALLPVSLLLCLWLALLYWLRFALMEDARWLESCLAQPEQLACQLRAALGLVIHWRLLAWLALGGALLALCLPRRAGWWLAAVALHLGAAALVLYSASLAVFAVVLAALRLVRAQPRD